MVLTKLYIWIFARPYLYGLNKLLLRMALRGLGILNYESPSASGEHHMIQRVLPGYIRTQNPVMFDVGANVGEFASALLKRFPTARIHVFEPNPKLHAALAALRSERVSVHACGLGEEVGALTLYDVELQDGSTHASLYADVIRDIHKKAPVPLTVRIETIDEIASREHIDFIDFLKIDTEGHELAVLRGARKYLRAGRIGCIHFEFNEMNAVSHVFMRDFQELLADYQLFRLLPCGLLPLGDDKPLYVELFAYQNILALPRTPHPGPTVHTRRES